MSKSLGNVVDPLEVIDGAALEDLHEKLRTGNLKASEVERAIGLQKRAFGPDGIPPCGTDAMRFALVAYSSQGRDVNLDIKIIAMWRRFCNKLWNATKFVIGNIETVSGFVAPVGLNAIDVTALSSVDAWILHELSVTATEVNEGFAEYNFSQVRLRALFFFMHFAPFFCTSLGKMPLGLPVVRARPCLTVPPPPLPRAFLPFALRAPGNLRGAPLHQVHVLRRVHRADEVHVPRR